MQRIVIERPSPNHGPRPGGTVIDMVLLHYTGMQTAMAALDRLCDPKAQVSAHYVIDEDGTLYQLVEEHRRAWHAGIAWWGGVRNINDRSIGIELVNPGHEHGYRPFPDSQMAALLLLLDDLIDRHGVDPARVLGHSDVAPSRKMDPGEYFDWPRLAERGLAIWPEITPDEPRPPVPARLLGEIGYDPHAPANDVVTAFQRRFLPGSITGRIDRATAQRIGAVHRMAAGR